MRATWTLPAQLLHIAGYVPTGMEHSVTASGFRQGARSPFFPASGRPVKTRINCLCQCVCCQTFYTSVVIFRNNIMHRYSTRVYSKVQAQIWNPPSPTDHPG
ncbi:hypothetical protein V8C40DRAFT_230570 [Trichoderma camerunense]